MTLNSFAQPLLDKDRIVHCFDSLYFFFIFRTQRREDPWLTEGIAAPPAPPAPAPPQRHRKVNCRGSEIK